MQLEHAWEWRILHEIEHLDFNRRKLYANPRGILSPSKANSMLSRCKEYPETKMVKLTLKTQVSYHLLQFNLKASWIEILLKISAYHHIHILIVLKMLESRKVAVNQLFRGDTTVAILVEIAPHLESEQVVHCHSLRTNHSSLPARSFYHRIWPGSQARLRPREMVW